MDAPSGNANRDEWAKFATDKGAPEEETRSVEEGGLSRDALRAKYSPQMLSGKVVKYVGTADVRDIDAKSWKSLGVDSQDKVVWDRSNNWTVPVADLQAGAVEYLDKQDDGFVVTNADT